jgi:hypothetical protein
VKLGFLDATGKVTNTPNHSLDRNLAVRTDAVVLERNASATIFRYRKLTFNGLRVDCLVHDDETTISSRNHASTATATTEDSRAKRQRKIQDIVLDFTTVYPYRMAVFPFSFLSHRHR